MRMCFWIFAAFGLALPQGGWASEGCTLSASVPIAFGGGASEHTLTLFWAGANCNAAVAGRAVFNADGHPVYIFTEDPNRIRLKEPGVPPHPEEWRPDLVGLVEAEIEGLRNTADLPEFSEAESDGTISPNVDESLWTAAREAALPMMCHRTGYSVSACFWLPPGAQAMQMLFESGS